MKLKFLFLTALGSLPTLKAMEGNAQDQASQRIRVLLLKYEKPNLIRKELHIYNNACNEAHNCLQVHGCNLESTARTAVILAKAEAKAIAEKCVSYACEASLNPKTEVPSFDLSAPTSLAQIKAMERREPKKEATEIPKSLQKLKEKFTQQLIYALENQEIILSNRRR